MEEGRGTNRIEVLKRTKWSTAGSTADVGGCADVSRRQHGPLAEIEATEMRGFLVLSGVTKASQSLRGLDWFEVIEIRGHIEEGAIAHYQVTLKVGFRLED